MDDFIRVGGLAAVSAALPRALRSLADIRIMLPGYRDVVEQFTHIHILGHLPPLAEMPACTLGVGATRDGLPVYILLCAELYERPGNPYGDESGRDWGDNDLRFGRFASAAAELAAGSLDKNWAADLVHVNDWQAALTPASVLEKLKKGNARFVEKNMRSRDWMAKVSATAGGQYPFATILACMDSRAPIELIFDQGIGDVFGIRIAGNIVNEDVLGSMEYATKIVGSKLLVVLGHTSCGAVKGSIDDAKLGNLTELLAKIRPAVSASGPGNSKDDAYVTKVAQANVSQAMKEIHEKSPTIKAQLDAGTVGLVGAIYDVSTGKVTFLPD